MEAPTLFCSTEERQEKSRVGGWIKHLIQINPLEDDFETELLRTKLMWMQGIANLSFVLPKINVDTNKGRAKTPVNQRERRRTIILAGLYGR